jgi:hypothetical protein
MKLRERAALRAKESPPKTHPLRPYTERASTEAKAKSLTPALHLATNEHRVWRKDVYHEFKPSARLCKPGNRAVPHEGINELLPDYLGGVWQGEEESKFRETKGIDIDNRCAPYQQPDLTQTKDRMLNRWNL